MSTRTWCTHFSGDTSAAMRPVCWTTYRKIQWNKYDKKVPVILLGLLNKTRANEGCLPLTKSSDLTRSL